MARARFKPPSPVFSAAELRRELRSEEQRKLNDSIKRLRSEVSRARRAVQAESRKARSDCLAALRLKLAELANEIADARAKLKDSIAQRRGLKTRSCSVKASDVRAEKKKELERKRSELRQDLSLRRAARTGRARGERAEKSFRQESDAEVIYNLEAEDPRLVPIFRKIGRSIKGSRDMTRTEAFLEWVAKHPEEIEATRAASVPTDDEFAAEMAAAYGQPDLYIPPGVTVDGDEVRRDGTLIGFIRPKAGGWRSSPYDYSTRLRVADFEVQQDALDDVLARGRP